LLAQPLFQREGDWRDHSLSSFAERNSAPEHIWNAAVWWHEAFAREGHPIGGYYALRDKGCSLLSTDE